MLKSSRLFYMGFGLFLIGLLCLAQQPRAQLTTLGVGGGFGAAASYAGPGNVVTNAKFFIGGRCYNLAYSGNVMDITDAATGNTTGTRLQCSGGVISALVSGSACTFVTGNACSSLATTCAVSCNVLTAYDQSGANACTGAVACDVTQATNASRPTLNTSYLNGRPCMVFNGSQLLSSSATIVNIVQPYTVSAVVDRTTHVSYADYFSAGGDGVQVGFDTSASNAFFYAGGSLELAAANDNTNHAIQSIGNGASSNIYVDGTPNTKSPGASDISSNIFIGGNGNKVIGVTCEVGIWPIAFGTSAGQEAPLMNTNQHGTNGYNF